MASQFEFMSHNITNVFFLDSCRACGDGDGEGKFLCFVESFLFVCFGRLFDMCVVFCR